MKVDKNEVYTAFEILIEEIKKVIDRLNEEGARDFRFGNYESARKKIEIVTRLKEFQKKVKALKKEWRNLFARTAYSSLKPKQHKVKRLQRGLRIPEKAFRRPILEALVELGGGASMKQVLNCVERRMYKQFTQYDYEPLPSSSMLCWQNTAQWCRYNKKVC